MPKFCNNPDCEAFGRPQEGRHCPYCGKLLISDEPTVSSSKKEISGDGINISRVMNDSHDTISNTNTTIVLNGKSLEDLTLKDRKVAYRKFCSEIITNGIITPTLRRKLDHYAMELDLPVSDRKDIEQLIRRSSVSTGNEITGLDQDNLDIIKAAVFNNRIRVNDMLPKLEAMSGSENDEVQYYYNLLLTCSSPASIINKYSDREQDIYWLTFWVNIAYMKNGQKVKSEIALRELSAWDTQSKGNLFLLQAADALLVDDLGTASMFYNHAENYSYLLNSFSKTIAYILKTQGIRRLSNSNEVNFYLEKIFGLKEDRDVDMAGSFRAPIPEGLRDRVDGKRSTSSGKVTPVQPIITTTVSNEATAKSRTGRYLFYGLIAAAIMALVLFYPRKTKEIVDQKPVAVAESPAANSTPIASAGANKSSQGKTTTATNTAKSITTSTSKLSPSSNSSSGTSSTKATQDKSGGLSKDAAPEPTQSSAATKAKVDPIAELKASADAGDKDAQYTLGMKYYEGNGVTKNFTTAFSYLKPLADAGYVKAFFPVAEMYHGGRGVTKDRNAAEKWYQKAADAGNAKAKNVLLNSF